MIKQTIPYLTFDGEAQAALKYYEKVFGAEVFEVQTFGEADFPTPPEADERIIHARFQKGHMLVYVSDSFPGQAVEKGNNFSLALDFDTEDEQKTVYYALAEEGIVHMELQETFWRAVYAKVQDPFGVIWDLNRQQS
ncbi:VOC family protein [Salibacterium aidingense]|uniref:VOC family protein n=1 Tax=Salibacterium aidingense TaxID=384933 RepID=UPI003BD9804D